MYLFLATVRFALATPSTLLKKKKKAPIYYTFTVLLFPCVPVCCVCICNIQYTADMSNRKGEIFKRFYSYNFSLFSVLFSASTFIIYAKRDQRNRRLDFMFQVRCDLVLFVVSFLLVFFGRPHQSSFFKYGYNSLITWGLFFPIFFFVYGDGRWKDFLVPLLVYLTSVISA